MQESDLKRGKFSDFQGYWTNTLRCIKRYKESINHRATDVQQRPTFKQNPFVWTLQIKRKSHSLCLKLLMMIHQRDSPKKANSTDASNSILFITHKPKELFANWEVISTYWHSNGILQHTVYAIHTKFTELNAENWTKFLCWTLFKLQLKCISMKAL